MTRPVAIQHPSDPNRPTVIRGDLYDPARHKLWGDVEAPAPAPTLSDAVDLREVPVEGGRLAAALAEIDDATLIRGVMEADDRVTAPAVYRARLREIERGPEPRGASDEGDAPAETGEEADD